MGNAENWLTYFTRGGHSHDGENSTKIDFSKYTEEDIAELRRALGEIKYNFQTGIVHFPEGITIGNGSGGSNGGTHISNQVPPPTTLNWSSAVASIEYEHVYGDVSWAAPSAATNIYGSQDLEYEVTLQKVTTNDVNATPRSSYYDGAPRIIRVKGLTTRFSNLDPGAYYDVAVRSVNTINIYSAPVELYSRLAVVDSTVPAAVATPTVTGGLTSIFVKWTENSEADVAKGRGSYLVNLSTSSAVDGNGQFTTITKSVVTKSNYATFTDLSTQSVYYVQIKAKDSSGNLSAAWSTTASSATGGVSSADNSKSGMIPWEMTWDAYTSDDAGNRTLFSNDWNVLSGSTANITFPTVSDSIHGGKVLRIVNHFDAELKTNIPYDPNKLYKISFRIRQIGADTVDPATRQKVYGGVDGVGSDGTARVNVVGANSSSNQHYVAVANVNITSGAGWSVYTGYFKGVGTPVSPSNDPKTPSPLHADVRYFRPRFIVNYSGGDGTAEIDAISVEEVGYQVPTANISDGSVVNAKLGPQAVEEDKIKDLAVATGKIAAGAVTTSKLTVGSISDNAVRNHSFEDDTDGTSGPDNWDIAWSNSGTPTFSVDSTDKYTGAKSLKIAISNTAHQGLALSDSIPVAVGEKWYISAWYKASASVTSTIRLRAVFGTTYNFASPGTSTVDIIANGSASITWTHSDTVASTAIVTVPAGVTWMRIQVGSVTPSAACDVWFDEVVARKATVTTVIDDNAVTTNKIVAGAITANRLNVTAGGGNLFPNSSFEDWSDGTYPPVHTQPGPRTWNLTNKSATTTLTRDATEKVFDSNSMKMVNTVAGESSYIFQQYNNALPNTKYTFTCYIKCTSFTAGAWSNWLFLLQDLTNGINVNDTLTAVTSGWERRTLTVTTGASTTNIRLRIYAAQATVYFDGAQLEVGDVATAYAPDTDEILPGTIVANMVSADAIVGDHIIADSIEADHIKVNAITATKIAADAVTTDKLLVTSRTENLISNASFESGTMGLTVANSSGPTRTGAQFQHGANSIQLTNNTGVANDMDLILPTVPIEGSSTYTATAYTRANTTTRSAQTIIVWIGTRGEVLSTSTGTSAANSNSAWTRTTAQVVSAPAGAVRAQVKVRILSAANTEVHYVDSVQLEKAGAATTFALSPIDILPGTLVADQIVAGSITGDHIDAGSITASHAIFASAAIVDADIASLTATKITAGTIGAHTIELTNSASSIIQTAGYTTGGANGWRILGDGTADFNNVTVRGSTVSGNITLSGSGKFRTGSGSDRIEMDTTTLKMYKGGTAVFAVTAGSGIVTFPGTTSGDVSLFNTGIKLQSGTYFSFLGSGNEELVSLGPRILQFYSDAVSVDHNAYFKYDTANFGFYMGNPLFAGDGAVAATSVPRVVDLGGAMTGSSPDPTTYPVIMQSGSDVVLVGNGALAAGEWSLTFPTAFSQLISVIAWPGDNNLGALILTCDQTNSTTSTLRGNAYDAAGNAIADDGTKNIRVNWIAIGG